MRCRLSKSVRGLPRLLALGGLTATLLAAGVALAQPATPSFQLELPGLADAETRPRRLGRAALETAGLLLGGTVWYWGDLEFNSRDWDLRWDLTSWRRKLTFEAVRFDQNLFQTNAVSHSRAGVAHYQVLRGNGLGFAPSLASTLAASVFWEYVVEFKEHPSANDMIVNTVSALAIGEPFYQLGEFFLRSRPTLFARGMAGALSPVAAMNDWADRRVRPVERADRFGLTTEVAHRLHFTAGYHHRTFDSDALRRETTLGVGADLVTQPGYARPGRFATWISPGAWTSIDARLDIGERGVTGGALLSRTTVLGRYFQRFARDPGGGVSGHGLLVGLGSAFDYEDSGRPDGADYLAVMNVLGPVFELGAQTHGVRLRWSGELYGDFAMVKSLAFAGRLPPMTGDVFRPGERGGRLPSVLGARGYYYALGVTAGTRLDLEYWGWDAGAEVRADHLDSVAGLDRFQEELTDEYDLVDRRVLGRAWLGLRPWGSWPRLSTHMDWRWRRGLAEELVGEHLDLRVGVALSFVF